MNRILAAAAVAAALTVLAGCSAGTPAPHAAAARPPAAATAAATAPAPPPVPSAAPADDMCTDPTCITGDIQDGLTGAIADSENVAVKVRCKPSTVRHHADAKTWTAWCKVGYSDGSTLTGHGNLVVDDQGGGTVTFQPQL
jgi:hypothetical protein